jgi:hypothetical protein
MERQGSSATFGNVIISANELNSGYLGGSISCVLMGSSTGAWLENVVITGNTCGLQDSVSFAGHAWWATGTPVTGLLISNNTVKSIAGNAGTSNASISASSCVIGPNLAYGNALAASSVSCGSGTTTTISPF